MSSSSVGIALLIAAMALLLVEPVPGGWLALLGLCLFLLLFVSGGLMVMGLLGTPTEIAGVRRSGLPPARAAQTAPVGERRFRRPRMSLAVRVLLVLLCGGPVVMGLVLLWAGSGPGPVDDALLLASPLLVSGLGLAAYLFCQQRQVVVVSPLALRLEGCRRQAMAWDDVVALRVGVPGLAGDPLGQMFAMYSRTDSVRVTGKLEQLDALRETISAATGLDWS